MQVAGMGKKYDGATWLKANYAIPRKLVNELVELFEIYKKAQLRNALLFVPSSILHIGPASHLTCFTAYLPKIIPSSDHTCSISSHLLHIKNLVSVAPTPPWRPT